MKHLFDIRYKTFVLFIGFFPLFVSSQDPGKYKFIKQEFNRLYFSKDSSSFQNLYRKLDRLKNEKNGRISVVHMGGSHVQGGTWSNTFVSNFQKTFVTAGGGYFVFPYKIAKTNGQPYATSFSNGKWKRCRAVGKEFCLPLGMSALSITTNDSSCNFGLALTGFAACKYVNIMKVYHNFNASFEFTPVFDARTKVSRTDHEDLGYTEFKTDMPFDSVGFYLVRKDTNRRDFILYGFSLENDLTKGFYLAGLGANGASSSSFLRCEKLIPQLTSLKGDLFILSLGVNDTQSKGFAKDDYIENYDTLITYIKKSNPGAAIILTTTTDNYIKRRTSNNRTIKARDAMFELMEKHDLAVWDLFSLMGGYRSISKWYKAGLATKDKVHFTPRGYILLGNMMYEALNTSYMNQKKQP